MQQVLVNWSPRFDVLDEKQNKNGKFKFAEKEERLFKAIRKICKQTQALGSVTRKKFIVGL
eukprot:11823666-Karenia_brevis.AAC.1